MTTASTQPTADMELHSQVIQQLLQSMDCAQYLKDSLSQFLGNITTNVNHKDLAYHLFCIVTLYISKQTTLDNEQMSVLCRSAYYQPTSTAFGDLLAPAIEQLRQDWSESNASSESLGAPLQIEDVDMSEDPDNVSQALSISRSITPDRFVREAEKCLLVASNFSGAVSSKDSKDIANLKSQYPFGYRLMTGQGWSSQSGLGPDGSGIQAPLDENTLAHTFRYRESPTGLGYTNKPSSKIPGNDNHTAPSGKQAEAFVDPASAAWHQYTVDPRGGDLTAKPDYMYDINTTLPREAVHSHLLRTGINSGVKTIIQDQCVIHDKWRDISNHTSALQIKKSVPQKMPKTTTETTLKTPRTFVLDGNSNGFTGW
ncbi:hypothetical protein F5B22DRAFT_659301 [Xylaria bambusicola]|uniref:uncharacterized protein n=1 Tax=Xylaria bambusicola TaxID=326684 RepID=UPI002007AC5A|nr:uncharacterized protein F5B22DRAFT_659301 [Xylaria bambusicola]KAI0508362.1 hypothetical protein F5B22DRAFT_659301 [Xylaria bambusicola]